MRFIDLRLPCKAVLLAALLAACSAPLPMPPGTSSSSQPPAQPESATAPTATAIPAPQGPDAALKKQFAKAVAAMQAGQDKPAMDLFSAIAAQAPQLASPHANLGILYFRQGRLAEAETAFKDALQRDGKDYVSANYLGMIYRKQGDFAAAKAAYERALAAKPDYGNAHLNLAILYDLYLGNLDKALDHYRQYQKDGGEGDSRLAGWLADLQQRMQDAGGAGKP